MYHVDGNSGVLFQEVLCRCCAPFSCCKSRKYRKKMGLVTLMFVIFIGSIYVLPGAFIYEIDRAPDDPIFQAYMLRRRKADLIGKAEQYLLNSVKYLYDHRSELSYDCLLGSSFLLGYANTRRIPHAIHIASFSKATMDHLSVRYEDMMDGTFKDAASPIFAPERENKLKLRGNQDWSNYLENDNYYLQGLCFRELQESCEMSDVCRKKYFYETDVMYSLTHDILYYVLRMKKGCSDSPAIIEKMCQREWEEAHRTWKLLNSKDTDKFCLFDLFLEQVVFCGMLGYSQFFKQSWIEYALNQMGNGACVIKSLDLTMEYTPGLICHHNTSTSQDALPWKLGVIGDGCSDHATELMQLLLAHFLYLQSTLEEQLKMESQFQY